MKFLTFNLIFLAVTSYFIMYRSIYEPLHYDDLTEVYCVHMNPFMGGICKVNDKVLKQLEAGE